MAIKNNNDLISAKTLSTLVKETYHTIDHWTSMGLLKPKIKGRTRYYEKENSMVICNRIRELQNRKMPLELIAQEIAKQG
ncbi:MAG: MerR family transcriptional regulator [Nitrospirae bacterium]|nr:MerR family transcriptional regulator [Nitrospirota bacterium]